MREESVRILDKIWDRLSRLGAPFIFLWIIMFTVVFSDALSYPAIPYLVKEFLLEELAVVAMIGFLSSIFSAVKIAANILVAFLGDKTDRNIIILITLAFLPPSFALLLFARNHLWILGSYMLFGIFYGALIPPLNAMVADLAQRENRGTLFAIFNLSWIISQIVAPMLGGFLSDTISLRFPIIPSLALSLAIFILFIIFRGILRGVASLSRLVSDKYEDARTPIKTLLFLCLIQIFSGLGSGVLAVVATAFLVYVIGASPTEIGLTYSLSWGIATAVSQIPGGRLSDRFGSRSIMAASTLISAPLLMLLPFSRSLIHYILISALSFLIGNLSSPAFSAWVATLMRRQLWSKGFGLTSASFSIGSVVGPIIGSLTWAAFKPNYLIPFSISTEFILLTTPFIAVLKEHKGDTQQP
ncbi:MAG: MFS transporter [Candidatus Bathyarchaeia archaeon]